jgi:hypothetical protein
MGTNFLDNIKKYWFLYGVITFILGWFAVINSRIYDSPEQKVEHEQHVKNSLSPIQQQKKYLLDSLDKVSAIKTRAERLELQRKKDSAELVKDSLFIDQVKRQTVQIEQIKAKLDNE